MTYRQKNMTLSDACEILSGYTARSALTGDEANGVPALQLGDLRDNSEIELSKAMRFKLEGKLQRYMVTPGDVLFRSRGERNTAAIAVGNNGEKAVALLPLMILRVHDHTVLPEFIMWSINQPEAQRYLDRSAQGTKLRMIKREALATMPISIPDLEIQKLVIEVSRLSDREADLLRELARKKEEFMNFALLRQVRKAQLHGNEAGHPVVRQPSKHTGEL